ncbi:replication termination factor 2 [Cyclospora cayetanensis]|uniref:Replication termination factor 2 n=1 Tax=Cyclospora cayetanensis TaxID=88456 RepID=A0A6P6S350_9EIME|nr:replication termination factor 2 [Cyclospora cayetanensis]
MGGDGGSFSGRAEMVRTKGFKFLRNLGGMGYTPNTQIRAGDERFGRNENRDLRTSTCALSEEKLRPPLVVCRVGRLYNKEKVITAMLEKALPPHMKHIKSLKDMKECRIEVNAATGFPICPITKADLSSGVRASIIWPCGFIVSNRALEAMTQKDAEISHPEHKISDSGKPRIKGTFVCPMCAKEHSAAEDLVPLSPDEEEIASLLEKATALQQAKKTSKKQKVPKPADHDGTSNSAKATCPATASPVTDAEKAPGSSCKNSVIPTDKVGSIVVPPKRLRDWVLESEPPALTPSSASKHRKVAA